MGIFLFIIGVIGWHVGMYGLFKKAGLQAAYAFIPFYNTWLIVQKINLPRYWFWLQLIPIAGQFITIWITIIFMMHFKRVTVVDHTLTTALPFVFFPYIGFNKTDKWHGHEAFTAYKKPASREWIDAGAFAIVAATLIRTFVFEAYVIPTGSMERTLLINDFLFVSKFSYGPRIPQTPLSFPFVHNTLPFSETKISYIKEVQVPYYRVKGYTTVKRNDVVVFNFPAGDTIINLPGFGSKTPYYDVLRIGFNNNREALMAEYPIIVHPPDKTDNYIKRCVAVGGDKLQIKEGVLYINNEKAFHGTDMQTDYKLVLNKPLPDEFLKDELGIDIIIDENTNLRTNVNEDYKETGDNLHADINVTEKNLALLKTRKEIISIEQVLEKGVDPQMFPFDTTNYPSTRDNFGPIYVPKKGDVLTITPQNIEVYRRLITNYEGNTIEAGSKPGTYTINGVETNNYKVKLNYYWMMGDNRHRSQDSRYWGFVPETMVVGKASLVWFSWNKGPRWKRIFKSIE